MIGENLPDFAVVLLNRPSVPPRDSEILERDTLRVEHAKNVMIGNDEEVRGRA
jgi:hypothetical protein